MNKKILYAIFLLLVLILVIYFVSKIIQNKSVPSIEQEIQKQDTITPPTDNNKKVNIYFPINRYKERLTFRKFGQVVGPDNRATCGRSFVGIHNADDLEILAGEENSEIPIFAISDGKVVMVNYIDGYGGLLVIETNINNHEYTLNYGHIRLSSTNLKVGDSVIAGQKLAVLGSGCSAETDGERKHLHFAIHKGDTIDVRGYLFSQNELESWLNPKEFLEENKATESNM